MNVIKSSKRFFESYARFTLKFRFVIGTILLGIVGLLAYQAQFLQTDTSNESFFVENDPVLLQYDEFKEVFGSDEFIYILYETDDVFSDSNLEMLKSISAQFDTVKYVEEITTLLNVSVITSRGDEIIVGDLIESDNLSETDRDSIRSLALGDKMIVNRLVSEDYKIGGIFLKTEIKENDGLFRKYITHTVRSISDQYSKEYNIKFYPVGVPIMDHDLDVLTGEETAKWGIACFILIGIFLFITFRTLRNVLLPLTITLLAIIATLGLKALFINPFSMLSIILPTLLIVICVGYCVHILNEFNLTFNNGTERKDAIIESISHTGLPCFLTAITTACGFLSLTVMKIVPGKNLGIFAASGTIVAFFLAITLLPILMSFGKKQKNTSTQKSSPQKSNKFVDSLIKNVHSFVCRKYNAILVYTAILVPIMAGGIFLLEIDTNFLTFLSERTQMRQDYDFVDSKFGGSSSLEIIVASDDEDAFKDPEMLKKLDAFEQFLANDTAMVSNVFSINNVIKQLHKVATDGTSEKYTVPESQDLISQLLFIYEISGGDDLTDIITEDYSQARLSIAVYSKSSAEYKQFYNRIRTYIADKWGEDVEVTLTGSMPQFVKLSEYTTQSQINSFALAFVVILVFMIINFGSFSIGAVSMIPNVLPIFATLALMGYANISLDFLTILIAAVCIGIAVDDTIHFLNRFMYSFSNEKSYEKALQESFNTSGRAILFTTVILATGFCMFGFSVISILQKFGLLSALTIVGALIADLLVLPALIIKFKLFGKEA